MKGRHRTQSQNDYKNSLTRAAVNFYRAAHQNLCVFMYRRVLIKIKSLLIVVSSYPDVFVEKIAFHGDDLQLNIIGFLFPTERILQFASVYISEMFGTYIVILCRVHATAVEVWVSGRAWATSLYTDRSRNHVWCSREANIVRWWHKCVRVETFLLNNMVDNVNSFFSSKNSQWYTKDISIYFPPQYWVFLSLLLCVLLVLLSCCFIMATISPAAMLCVAVVGVFLLWVCFSQTRLFLFFH